MSIRERRRRKRLKMQAKAHPWKNAPMTADVARYYAAVFEKMRQQQSQSIAAMGDMLRRRREGETFAIEYPVVDPSADPPVSIIRQAVSVRALSGNKAVLVEPDKEQEGRADAWRDAMVEQMQRTFDEIAITGKLPDGTVYSATETSALGGIFNRLHKEDE